MNNTMVHKYRVIEYIFIGFTILAVLWEFQPYYSWATFHNGILNSVANVGFSMIFATASILFFLLSRRKIVIDKRKTIIILLAILVEFYLVIVAGLNPTGIYLGLWISLLFILVFFSLDITEASFIFGKFRIILAILIVPSMIYFLFANVGIGYPFDILASKSSAQASLGIHYQHSFGGIVGVYPYTSVVRFRLTGIFDEPGLFGTICALMLASDSYEIKHKWYNVVYLIGGLFSYSVAFIMITIMYFMVQSFLYRRKKSMIVLLLILLIYIVFESIPFNNTTLLLIQSRIAFSGSGLVGDNRTNEAFNLLMSNSMKSDISTILFGNGHAAFANLQMAHNEGLSVLSSNFINASSWKMLLFDYGIVGIIIFISWIILCARYYITQTADRDNKIRMIAFLFVYIANLYQRPSTFSTCYMFILIGGLSFLLLKKQQST